MRAWRRGTLSIAVVASGLLADTPHAQAPTLAAQLDRYLAGQFTQVLGEVAASRDFGGLLSDLEHHGEAWIDAGRPADRARRKLAAATFALEAARLAAETGDWKGVQHVVLELPGTVHLPGIPKPTATAADALWWKTPPRLVEWGCALLRRESTPTPAEHLWQLASVATVERAGDWEFLIGSPWDDRGNPKEEFEHLRHIIARFPDEPRFALAQAVAIEFRTWPQGFRRPRNRVVNPAEAIRAFDHMSKDPAIGGEASLRLGYLRLRTGRTDDALSLFARVETMTRDPYVIYLARYFRGQALERKNQTADAERAYRAALATIPRAQSATMALAALLARSDHRQEASALVEASLSGDMPADPWRGYEAADNRFWPELIADLHAEVLHGAVEAPSR